MTRHFAALVICLYVCLFAVSTQADDIDESNVYGLWLSQAKDGHILVSDCGDGTPCGALVWVGPKSDNTEFDARNKDQALRTRPLMGVPIIWGYKRSKKGWKSGSIYSPETGKTHRSSIQLQSANVLTVKGCRGPFCMTNRWTRIIQANPTPIEDPIEELTQK